MLSLRVNNLRMPVEAPESTLRKEVAKRLGLLEGDIAQWRILRKSLDARSRRDLRFVYSVAVTIPEDATIADENVLRGQDVSAFSPKEFHLPQPGQRPLEHRPVVVGSGPAGLLAAYVLALHGYCPIVLERGRPVKERVRTIRDFDAGGPFDPEDNYLFGEGGAGTFSDGKLTCRMSGPDVDWVLEQIVVCGGRSSISYEHRPHLGSNKLPMIVRNFRRKIEACGGEFRFGCRMDGIDVNDGRVVGLRTSQGFLNATQVVLALGHSARDSYQMLHILGVPLEPKAFQLGLRLEQPQEQVNVHKYGRPEYLELLGAADYTLTTHSQRDVYTFCMCAGGYVIPSISEPNMFCTNGMSNSRHDSPFANSGVMVTLEPDEFGSNHPLAGMELQRRYEAIAFEMAGRNYLAPIQRAADFLAQRTTDPSTVIESSYKRGVCVGDLEAFLPPEAIKAIRNGLPVMDKKWNGDLLRNATLVGPEMRGSSPIRIARDQQTRQVPGFEGLYPVGEGAGYAGGIISAAVDGLRTALQIVEQFAPLETVNTSAIFKTQGIDDD